MYFIDIPQHYTPLAGSATAIYIVKHTEAADIDIRILDANDNSLIAAKRFASLAEVSFDIVPVLRRIIRFHPEPGDTGFVTDSGRCPQAIVKALFTNDESSVITTSTRVFLPTDVKPTTPSLFTSMPLERIIPEGACDELSFFTSSDDDPLAVTVTAVGPDSISAQQYSSQRIGLQPFRLNTNDFPGAETITVDAGACGQVAYTIVPAREGAVRLAWRSHAGSLEHYSFPVVRETSLRVDKTRIRNADGLATLTSETESQTLLVSAYERSSVAEALAGVIEAPEVWLVGEEGYSPVDIATDEAVIRRHGALSCLEIAIRSTRKNPVSWN